MVSEQLILQAPQTRIETAHVQEERAEDAHNSNLLSTCSILNALQLVQLYLTSAVTYEGSTIVQDAIFQCRALRIDNSEFCEKSKSK